MADDLTRQSQNETDPQPREASGPSPAGSGGRGAFGPGRPQRGARGERRPGRGGRPPRKSDFDDSGGLDEAVVKIYRCAKVVKGGRRFSFSALVVVGDRTSKVGVGYGKANEVPSAVDKARKQAQRNMVEIKLAGTTIPHQVKAKYRASQVIVLPAGRGTGVIAGASVRAVMELAGIKDVLTKVHGSTSPKNLVKAAFAALAMLRSKDDFARLRDVAMA